MIENELSPFSAQGGINFYIGNNAEAKGYFMSPQGISGSPIEQVKTSILYAEKEAGIKLTPSQASRYWLNKGLKFIKDNPHDTLLLYLKKFALFWSKEEIPLNISYSLARNLVPIFQLPFIPFGIISPLAIIGILLSVRGKKSALLNLFIFSYMVSVIIFFVSTRYRLPVVPFLIICASSTLYHLVAMMRAGKIKSLIIVTILCFIVSAGVNVPSEYFKLASTPEHYNNLGKLYYAKGNLDKAIINLREALAMNPSFVEAHCNLGNVYFEKGMVKESIDEYKNALKINPDYALAHYNLGLVYNKKNMLEEALSAYHKALVIDPNYAEAHSNLGFIYGEKGMLDDAIEECEKAVAINPNLLEVHTNLGFFYRKKGMLDKAIKACKKALDINPDYALAHYNLSVNYYYKGNYPLAIVHCDKALASGYSVHQQFLELLKPYRQMS